MSTHENSAHTYFAVSPQLLAETLAQAADAIIMVDAHQRIVYLNAKAALQYEVDPTATLGRPLSDLYTNRWLHPADEAAAVAALAQQGQWRGRNFHLLPSGKSLIVESTITRVHDAAGREYLLAMIRDITAYQQTEIALREIEQLQHLAMEGAQIGTWAIDLDTQATFWGPHCRQILGVSPHEPATLPNSFALMHADDRPDAITAVEAVAAGATDSVMLEVRVLWPDASIRWVAVRGSIFVEETAGLPRRRLIGVVLDITERKLYEESLLRANRRVALAERAAHAFLYEWDLLTGNVERSEGIYRVLGYHPEELAGDIFAWRDLIHPDDYARVGISNLPAALAQEQFSLEYRLRHRDGHFLHVWDQAVIERDAARRPIRIVGITVDISELKQAQDALRELNDTLEQRVATRTAELERTVRDLDRFAYVASHDLKAPLRGIDYLAQWLEEDLAGSLPPTAQAHLAKLRGRVTRLEALLDDLLLYSRAGRKRYEPEMVDTAALVAGIVELLSPPPGFQVTVDGYLPTLYCERPPIETVFRNLIQNAIKHHDRPDHGRVSVSAQIQPGWAEFCVRDNGPGIELKYHERIFELFQTLRPRDELEASGMGLAIVKKTVESFGGSIRVESTPGQGAAFAFTWPITPP